MLFIVRLTQQYDVKLSCIELMKLHVSTPWGHLQAYKISYKIRLKWLPTGFRGLQCVSYKIYVKYWLKYM